MWTTIERGWRNIMAKAGGHGGKKFGQEQAEREQQNELKRIERIERVVEEIQRDVHKILHHISGPRPTAIHQQFAGQEKDMPATITAGQSIPNTPTETGQDST